MKKQFYLFFTALVFAGPLYAGNIPVDTLAFRLGTDNRIYVECRVNDSEPLEFLFDTGATDMVMNPQSPKSNYSMTFDKVVNNLGTTGSNEVKQSSSNRLAIGRHTEVDGLEFIAINYPPDAWDGVLGQSFMSRYIVEVDYKRRCIYLYSREQYTPPKDVVKIKMQMRINKSLPCIPLKVHINGKKYNVMAEVDTGSDRTLDLNTPFVKRHGLLGKLRPFAFSRITSSDGNSGELKNVHFDKVMLGSISLPYIPGALSTLTEGVQASDEIDGMLGNNFLQRFDLVIDLQGQWLYLKPNRLMYKPFYDFLVQ